MEAKLQTALIGLSGAGSIEVVDQVATLNPAVITDGVGLVPTRKHNTDTNPTIFQNTSKCSL